MWTCWSSTTNTLYAALVLLIGRVVERLDAVSCCSTLGGCRVQALAVVGMRIGASRKVKDGRML